jgi:hypothetical protein
MEIIVDLPNENKKSIRCFYKDSKVSMLKNEIWSLFLFSYFKRIAGPYEINLYYWFCKLFYR